MNGEERKIEGEKEWHSYRGARERKKKEKVGEERERGKSWEPIIFCFGLHQWSPIFVVGGAKNSNKAF